MQSLFDGRPIAERHSAYSGEDRTLTIGIQQGVFVTAVWTERHGNIRLISTRRSRRNEIAYYLELHRE